MFERSEVSNLQDILCAFRDRFPINGIIEFKIGYYRFGIQYWKIISTSLETDNETQKPYLLLTLQPYKHTPSQIPTLSLPSKQYFVHDGNKYEIRVRYRLEGNLPNPE